MKRLETERILREIGAAQHGIAARMQLMRRGLGRHAIDRLVRSGRLIVLRPGLYQIGPVAAERTAEAAAAMACRPDGAISHVTATVIHGMREANSRRSRVEVIVPRRRRLRIDGVRIHRVRDLRPDEVRTVEGIPITTPARTLLDIAETVPSREVEQALATALRRRLVTRKEMRRMVERHPTHRGAPVLRRLLELEHGPAFTRSEAEAKLLEITRAADLPRPELNVHVLGHEVDFLWRGERVVAEVDGYAFHGSVRSFTADRRRDAELTAAGYGVLRFTWEDLVDRRLATVACLARALVRHRRQCVPSV